MLESLDNAKPFDVARAADVVLAADPFHYMAGWGTKIEGNTIGISALPTPGEYLACTLREPVGIVGQITPWNFPLLIAAWKLGPALAAGCTVLLKPAEQGWSVTKVWPEVGSTHWPSMSKIDASGKKARSLLLAGQRVYDDRHELTHSADVTKFSIENSPCRLPPW